MRTPVFSCWHRVTPCVKTAAIYPDVPQSRTLLHGRFQHPVRSIPILDIGWMDDHHHQIAFGINQNVSLAPGHFFPPSKPHSPPASVVFTL
jgi:hypothetical protein